MQAVGNVGRQAALEHCLSLQHDNKTNLRGFSSEMAEYTCMVHHTINPWVYVGLLVLDLTTINDLTQVANALQRLKNRLPSLERCLCVKCTCGLNNSSFYENIKVLFAAITRQVGY
jgi:hypothetical protein